MGVIIDISHHQNPAKIDYDKLAKEVDLVIIRTQYGSRTIDRHYKTHHTEFKKRGVHTAAYAWVRGVSISDMEKEATDFYNRTKDLNPTFWFLDVEEKSMDDMRAGVNAYAKKLRSLGAKNVGVYIANHLYKSFNIDVSQFDAVWIPHYGSNNGQPNSKPDHPCDLHQYTDKGRLNGYSGNLDLNRIISDKKLEYFTGIVKEIPEPKVKSAVKKESNDDYLHIVKDGDTLSHIAAKNNVTVDYLVTLNDIGDPNRIYPGQRIKLKGKLPKEYHYVKSGENMTLIAKKYGTTLANLRKLNPSIKDINVIYPKQKIRVK